MEPLQVAQGYFDAWNNRDAAAIVACFAEGGIYRDPSVPQGVTGEAIGAYASGLWAGFPDLSFELVSAAPAGAGMVAAQWRMRGTNTGSFMGLPPTGRSVTLPGADFIEVEGAKIRLVQGYFDSRALPQQLGLQVVVQPKTAEPFTFGVATSVQSGKHTKPGAFGITNLRIRSEQEVQQVRDLSRPIAVEMLGMRGFIGWMGATIGNRMVTITAWEKAEDILQLRHGTHGKAMSAFFWAGIERRRHHQRVDSRANQSTLDTLLRVRAHAQLRAVSRPL
ncbi:MAG: ester cyclase [Anaerolineae bacterium]